jgi:hypothetical protein
MSSSAHNFLKNALSKFLSFPWAGCPHCRFLAGLIEVFHFPPFINSGTKYFSGLKQNSTEDIPASHGDGQARCLDGARPFVLERKNGHEVSFTWHPDSIWLVDKTVQSVSFLQNL